MSKQAELSSEIAGLQNLWWYVKTDEERKQIENKIKQKEAEIERLNDQN